MALTAQTQVNDAINGEVAGGESGYSVSVSANGNFIAIGARRNNDNGENSGQARVYQKTGASWTQVGSDINGEEGANLGISVALSADATILAAGATYNHFNAVSEDEDRVPGLVKIFRNTNGNWVQIGNDIVGTQIADSFGISIALSDDGQTIAVGAPSNADTFPAGGEARVFSYDEGSDEWIQLGQDINNDQGNSFLGRDVALSADGTILAVGIPNNDVSNPDSDTNDGTVRVYEYNGTAWTQIGEDIVGEAGSLLGWNVSLSANGNTLAVGMPFSSINGLRSGEARVYRNTGGTWTQLGMSIEGENAQDEFGICVSLSSDGFALAVGAYKNDDNGNDAGHASVYLLDDSDNWGKTGNSVTGAASGDRAGWTLSLSNNGYLAVGAHLNDENGTDAGQTIVYAIPELLSVNSKTRSAFNLYPNPATTHFTIVLDNNTVLQEVSLYNIMGQKVATSNQKQINITQLPAGTYVVAITTNTGKTTKKLLVQ